jgi:beta-glucosidase-like glycosyl hydrolase/CubicO group peptidase (beta-lactamase class C family)
MRKKLEIALLTLLFPVVLLSQNSKVPFLNTQTPWADSVFKTLNSEERIAQLLHIAAYSNRNNKHMAEIAALIKKYKIGGLIFFQGGPVRQADQTNYYQSISKVPLMISIDAEWGLKMRLDSTIKFPFQMALGAIKNDSLIYEMGREIAKECVRMGIQVNFAPVADINNNPNNPVINYRSFGENKYKVSRKSSMYMKGMQHEHVLANAKHFPGHGDTDSDSHKSLPIIKHGVKRLDSLELFPFKNLINEGVASIMVAHLSIPSLDSTPNLASTLSKPIVSGLLKEKLGFQGIVFTDALNMKGVAKYYEPGQVDVKALLAGNDALLFSEDVPKAIEEIQKAIKKGLISQKEVDARCYKQLKAKEWAGLDKLQKIETKTLIADINSYGAKLLNRKLVEASLTVLRNEDELIPVKDLLNTKIACVSIGTDKITKFQQRLANYTKTDNFFIPKDASSEEIEKNKEKLKNYDLVICSVHDMSMRPNKHFGITEQTAGFVDYLSEKQNTIVVLFGNAYALREFKNIQSAKGLIVAYQESDNTQDLSAQLIFGGIGANATLPVTVNQYFKEGNGIQTKGGIRFKYTLPEELGMNSDFINKKIDSIANTSIALGAFPGVQVFAAKDGKVFFHKTYGYKTFDSLQPVKKNNLYDFASVTKMTGALPNIMKLYDMGKIKLDVPFATYWPDFKGTNKAQMTVREVLAHQSGMVAWVPYWKTTIKKNGKYKWHTFKADSSKNYPVKITGNLWLHKNYKKKIYKAIKKTEMGEKKYKYSGLSFYLYPQIVKNITGIEYETYSKQNFYQPLGAYTLTYNPMRFYPLSRIIPTENDTFFRKEQIHGTVHDEGAIMMGGVSSNAGLFGMTEDLAKIMQMYLQMGEYGGKRYISDSTMRQFTKVQYPENNNRRALGFDKPSLKNKNENSCAPDASKNSFGHSGYTGTFAWVDPDNGLLFVFMSNRVFPTRDNRKIYTLNIRPSIHQVFYDALEMGIP